jgi:uncharacterized membrane protein
MSARAAITVLGPPDEVERRWRELSPVSAEAATTFKDAPGDRGTEIHVEIQEKAPAGKLGEAVQKLVGTDPIAKTKDELRHFKQIFETGEIVRSPGYPEGEALERKRNPNPAQPLGDTAGV